MAAADMDNLISNNNSAGAELDMAEETVYDLAAYLAAVAECDERSVSHTSGVSEGLRSSGYRSGNESTATVCKTVAPRQSVDN